MRLIVSAPIPAKTAATPRTSTSWRLAWLAMMCLAACPHSPKASESADWPKPVVSLKEMRDRGVVRQKWDLSCGAAALATLLTYGEGDPVSEVEVAKAMLKQTDPLKVKVRLGFSLLDLKRFAASRGYDGDGYGNVTLEDLKDLAPAIVPINANGYSHFVVYRGRAGDVVFLADPAFGNRTMTVEKFDLLWESKIAFAVARHDPTGEPTSNGMAPGPDDLVLVPGVAVRSSLR